MTTAAGHTAGRTRRGSRRPLRSVPAARREAAATAALGSALVLAGIALTAVPHRSGALGGAPGDQVVTLSFWYLVPLFVATGTFVAHVEVNSETHSFSLSEVPLLLGLLFANPAEFIAARLVGEALVLVLYARQAPAKILFNLSVFFAETALATAVYGVLAPSGTRLGPAACVVAFVAVAAAGQLGAAAVWAVIRIHAGRLRPTVVLLSAAVTSLANGSLAVVAAVVAVHAPWALAALVLFGVVLVTVYRGYAGLARRYGGLQLLYEFTTATANADQRDRTAERVLREAARLLRARTALALLAFPDHERVRWELLEYPGGGPGQAADGLPGMDPDRVLPGWLREQVRSGRTLLIPRGTQDPAYLAVLAAVGAADLVAAPLAAGEDVTGILLVADRLGDVSTFDDEDALLLAAVSSQAAVALENAGLIEKLHDQIRAREHDALHDALTGLPNRALFLRTLDEQLGGAGASRTAVLLMDLNGFKDVNDTLGHHTGDGLLQQVAVRLRSGAPAGSTVARMGGDEFAVVVPALGSAADGLRTAEELHAILRQPFALDALTLEVGASIGVAIAPEHATDGATLLQRADVAMYTAKATHLPAALYDPGGDWHTHDRLRLAHELRRAIESGQITVAYQPIARTGDGRVTAVEALARWHHPELGAIGPDTFIGVAERTGLIDELTWSVLDQAAAQTRAWRSAGLDLAVNVNLSVHLLRDDDLHRKVLAALARHRVPPAALTLEVTETGIMTDPGHMTRTLERLATAGITLAIDDFGIGQSSLTYLQRLPATKVKIDKSFVLALATDPNARTIVKSVIELAHNLDMQAVAEGVEDQRILDHLAQLGCDFVQGYYLSRPIPGVEVTEWLTERHRSVPSPRTPLRSVRH